MLLPSALTCDSSGPQRYNRQPALYSSPPLSPPPSSSYPTITNIYSTCRALQSMLTPPPPPTQLPSPPITHAEAPSTSPFKLRLRTRPSKVEDSTTHIAPRKRITKRTPPRGANKRRRALDDVDEDSSYSSEEENTAAAAGPSTPKRMRLAPEVLPRGLERSDFYGLHLQQLPQGQLENADNQAQEGEVVERDEWSTEEDRILVELVLEKLKLTKSDWQDCARSLGKDKYSVGKRWKSLMERGDIGLKKRRSRARLCTTWR